MKNLLKRCVSALTAAVICAGFAVPVTLAAEVTTGVTEIAAFNNFEYKNLDKTVGDDTVGNNKVNPSGVAYGSGKSSLAWTLQSGSGFTYTLDTPVPIAATDTIKVRMRSSSGTQKFNVVFSASPAKLVPDVTEEWAEYSYTGRAISSLDKIIFNCGGYSQPAGTFTTGAIIYIDSIWVEKKTAAYNKVDYPSTGSGDATAELVSFNTPDTSNVIISGWTQKATTTNARKDGNGMYRFFTIPEFKRLDNKITTNTVNVSAGGYKYMNMWVYSPRPQNGGVRISCGSTLVDGVTMNWSGWKLVSLALPAAVQGNNSLNQVTLSSNQYRRSAAPLADKKIDSLYSLAGQTEATCTSEIDFGIESIWLSKNQPADANKDAKPAAVETVETQGDLGTDIVIADYNKNEPGADTHAAAVANSYKGGKSARSRRFGGVYLTGNGESGYTYKNFNYEKDIPGCSKEAEFIIFNDSSQPLTGIERTDYLNFWIYNPSVKYDSNADYTEYVLAINHNATSNGDFANKTFGIIANFEGWKRFSIPMSEINSSWSADKKIQTIKITTNAWLTSGTNTDKTKMLHEHTEDELEKGYRTGSYYNSWPDVYNFFDVEKMWISKEPPKESFTSADVEKGFERKDIEIINKDFGLKTVDEGRFIDVVSGDAILLKAADNNKFEVVSLTTAVDSHNVTVSAANWLETGKSYYVLYPDIYDTDGNKYAERPTFRAITKSSYTPHIIVDPENPASASVILVSTEGYDKSCLVGALFGAEGNLKKSVVSRYESDPTVTVTLEDAQDGDTVRYFFFDGASLTPFQAQVEQKIGAAE